jgi:hypothetical protein
MGWESARATRGAISIVLALALQAPTLGAAADPPDRRSEADRLFYEGKELGEQGRASEACAKLEQSRALLPRSGTLLNLGQCREDEGRHAAALERFQEALRLATLDGNADRQQIARHEIEHLRLEVVWVSVAPPPDEEVPGLTITLDGAVLSPARWSSPVAVDPGEHVMAAIAPGRERFEVGVTAREAGTTQHVRIPVLRALDERTHRFQIGAVARVDVDPIHPGARAVLGLTFGVDDHLEIGASALLGHANGVEPQLTLLLGRSAWKPLINAGVPVFFVDGARVGLRGAVGVQWDVHRHFGVFTQVGGAYFPNAQPGYVSAPLLPALGIQGRI